MVRTLSILAALSAMVAASGPANAQDAATFTPDGPWVADYGGDYCRLARNFTDGSARLALALERIQHGATARLVLIGQGLKPYRGAKEIGYHYLPEGETRQAPLMRSETADGQQYFNFGNVFISAPPTMPKPGETPSFPVYNRAAEQDYAAAIKGLRLDGGLTSEVEIQTGSLKPVIAALQACTDDLLASWGLDAKKHQAITRPAMPASDTSKWLPSGTIGFGDFGKLVGGSNAIRVMVDADGKPTACKIHWVTLNDLTNGRICKAIMDNGTFKPALDGEGQAMASYWTVEPFWLMGPGPGG